MRWLLGGALASVALALAAVSHQPEVGPDAAPWRATDAAAAPWPRHFPGAGLPIPAPPQRMVAASVFSAEVLLELAPDRLVGVHSLAGDARFSGAAEAAVRLGRPTDGTAEHVLFLRPDLVITDPFTAAETQALLERAGVPILRMGSTSSLDDVRDNLRRIGHGTGLDAAAARLIETMDARLHGLGAGAADRGRWGLLCIDGALHTYGRGSLFDAVVSAIGARNVAAERGAPAFRKLDAEAVLGWRPDALVMGVMPGEEAAEMARLRQDPVLSVLPCVRAGRVAFVPHAGLAATSHLVAGFAERLAGILDGWGPP